MTGAVSLPPLWRLYGSALLAMAKRGGADVALPAPVAVGPFRVERSERSIAAYRRHCGFPDNAWPLSYLYVLATGAQIAALTDPRSPYPVAGLVQTGVTLERGKHVGDWPRTSLVEVTMTDLGPVPGGRDISIVMVVNTESGRSIGTVTARYRLRGKSGHTRAPQPVEAVVEALPTDHQLSFGARRGAAYAKVSGDWNPIHLSGWTARLFGFKRPILQGMDTLGVVLALSVNDDVARVQAEFRKPVQLPAKPVLQFVQDGEATRFVVTSEGGSVLHVQGALT